MRRVFALLSVLCLCAALSFTTAAEAQATDAPPRDEVPPSPGLRVAREGGAEGCPDTAQLSERVARLRGRPVEGAQNTYLVTFTRQDDAYRAAIRMSSGDVRVLSDRGQTCESLEQATALTLALLLDSDAQALDVKAPEPPASHPAPAPAPPRPRPNPRPARQVEVALSLGGAGLFGVARTAAPVALADVGLFVNRFRTSVGALWMPAQQLELSPGQLRETLLSGAARTCYAALSRPRLRFDVCTGIYAGLVTVEARGYTRSDVVKRAWLAVPVELSLSLSPSPLGVELGVSALLPLRQSDFAIDNLGTAYESWPIGGLLSLKAVGHWPL
jgi:hypothetical protein